jgi:large subunit ribosomal protein L18
MQTTTEGRERRKRRIRKKVHGTPERPRLTVFRSAKHIYAQVIDDAAGATLASASTMLKTVAAEGNKTTSAKAVGQAVAKACLDKGIASVVFDRNGYRYHGRVRALADAAREAGLQF